MKINDNILLSVQKPARYSGNEFGEVKKDKNTVSARVAFAFADTYEIGMSNLGMRILYGCLNEMDGVWCERVYAPGEDMEAQMRQKDIELFALESGDPILDFDFFAFTLQYELCYTNILNMLTLAKIPLYSSQRDESFPLVIAGGPCSYNPEPLADFFDLFVIGEGEETLTELVALYQECKKSGYKKEEFLKKAVLLGGIYVPSFYDVTYLPDGKIDKYTPKYDFVPKTVTKRIISDMDKVFFPKKVVMPYIETVHDRISLEVYRGCIRGCRFCQAGMVYRPVREKSVETLANEADCLFCNTGYDEISLLSLSISDYSEIDTLTDTLVKWTDEKNVSLSLPSLRADSFTKELMDKVSSVRQSGITFAPEAGTERLRDVINKNLTMESLKRAVNVAYAAGKNQVKLYFMIGHPTETYEDLDGIYAVAKELLDEYYKNGYKSKRPPQITLSVACFIPKPFTPFQWEKQDSVTLFKEKQEYLKSIIADRKIKFNYHDAEYSYIEAVFARGDRRLSKALEAAAKRGFKFDAWEEYFSFESWMEVFKETGIDGDFYACREYSEDEVLAWDVLDCGVTKEFLLRERHKAYKGVPTANCSENCAACGANKLGGKTRWCPKMKGAGE